MGGAPLRERQKTQRNRSRDLMRARMVAEDAGMTAAFREAEWIRGKETDTFEEVRSDILRAGGVCFRFRNMCEVRPVAVAGMNCHVEFA